MTYWYLHFFQRYVQRDRPLDRLAVLQITEHTYHSVQGHDYAHRYVQHARATEKVLRILHAIFYRHHLTKRIFPRREIRHGDRRRVLHCTRVLTTPMPSMAKSTVAKKLGHCPTDATSFTSRGISIPLKT